MKMINHLNEAFLQLRTGIEKLLDPLMMFVTMLRTSVEHPKKVKTKPVASATVKKKKTVKK